MKAQDRSRLFTHHNSKIENTIVTMQVNWLQHVKPTHKYTN